jgi:hypothetical protein
MRSSYLIGALAAAAALILGITYFLRQAPEPAPAEEAVSGTDIESGAPAAAEPPPGQLEPGADVMEETPPSPAIDEPVLVLPPLNESDAFVRERLPDTLPEPWRERDDLLRRTAVVLENATRGEIPKRQLSFMAPDGPYPVQKVPVEGQEKPRFFVDPAGYERYDRYLDMLESMPAEQLSNLLLDTGPLLGEALAELGSQVSVQTGMVETIDQILAVPVLEGEVELIQPKVLYEYADPELEGLSALQKQVLRMGPDNVVRLQSYLRDLRDRLVR